MLGQRKQDPFLKSANHWRGLRIRFVFTGNFLPPFPLPNVYHRQTCFRWLGQLRTPPSLSICSETMKRNKIPYGTRLPVRFTLCERDLIREHTFFPGRALDLAVVEGKGIQVELSLDDIEEMQGYVAAEANHCEDRHIQKRLDAVFEKLQDFLDSYDDRED